MGDAEGIGRRDPVPRQRRGERRHRRAAACERESLARPEPRSHDFALLKRDPRHPSLHFKRVGRYWSARVGLRYRALAVEVDDVYVWFWIGSHADYDRLIR